MEKSNGRPPDEKAGNYVNPVIEIVIAARPINAIVAIEKKVRASDKTQKKANAQRDYCRKSKDTFAAAIQDKRANDDQRKANKH